MDNNMQIFSKFIYCKMKFHDKVGDNRSKVKQASTIFQCVPSEQREGVLPSFSPGPGTMLGTS